MATVPSTLEGCAATVLCGLALPAREALKASMQVAVAALDAELVKLMPLAAQADILAMPIGALQAVVQESAGAVVDLNRMVGMDVLQSCADVGPLGEVLDELSTSATAAQVNEALEDLRRISSLSQKVNAARNELIETKEYLNKLIDVMGKCSNYTGGA
jgi:hypothetical protein